MIDRNQLENAIAIISTQRARYGDAVVDTAIEVLEARLVELPAPAVNHSISNIENTREQRKQVTVLFAALDGFTRLSETSRNTERLNQIDLLWRQIDETIHNHGGIVDKHMGDVIMGIFGSSVSREDDPERAVRCALALRQTVLESLAIDQHSPDHSVPGGPPAPAIRIGINTGRVLLGQVGSDMGQTAIGDAVNVASRLKEASVDAGIYISQDTYRLVRTLFQVEPLGAVTVKGRKTPVGVFRVIGARPRSLFPRIEGIEGIEVPMIGREKEMSFLRGALSRIANERRGEFVLVVGDAGVGKSRLIGEFYRQLEPKDITIFQARADQRQVQVPYSLLRDLLVSHFNIEESDRVVSIESKIARRLIETLPADRRRERDAEAHRRARAIGRLIGLYQGGTISQDPVEMSAKVDRERAITGILEYLDTIARRSVVSLFLLENMHWADEDSLAVLERVSTTTADSPVLMIGVVRPTFLDNRPEWPGVSDVRASRILLQPLNEPDCRELVLNILRKLPHTPPTLLNLIVHSAAGNPFYVEELIMVLIEDGVIVPSESIWLVRPRELTRLRVPATLTGVLQARLDRLPEGERVILQQAAVIGDEFWSGALQQINGASRYPYREEQIESALQGLERRDMIYRTPTTVFTGTQAYLFKHTVLREVAYESVLLRDRPAYHLHAAIWLENQSGERIADYAAPIAQHYEQGGRAADAAHLYELAASRSLDEYKVSSAIQYFRKVLGLLRGLPQHLETRLAVMEGLGTALQMHGYLVEALENYHEMHHIAELDGNILSRARARNAQAIIFHELGDDVRALELAIEAEQLARLTGAEMERVRSLLLQSEAAGRLGRTHETLAAATQAIEQGRALGATRETARGLILLSSLPSAVSQPQAAQQAGIELTALVEELQNQGDAREAADILSRIGELALAQGRPEESIDYFNRALPLARAGGNLDSVAVILRWMGTAWCRLGKATEAIARIEEAAGLAETIGNRYLRLGCRLAMGETLMTQGYYAAAEAMLRQVIGAAEDRQRLGSWKELPHAYRLLVEVLNLQGRGDEALLVSRMPGT